MGQNLAAEQADSLAKMYRERAESGAPFGHVDELGSWHDVDECEEGAECEEASAHDYLEDVLDINYIVNADGSYKGARILVGFGGPNVWIDTLSGVVEVSWWSAPEYRSIPRVFTDSLDDALSELYQSIS